MQVSENLSLTIRSRQIVTRLPDSPGTVIILIKCRVPQRPNPNGPYAQTLSSIHHTLHYHIYFILYESLFGT